MDVLRPLAETDDAVARLLACRKVHVRELRHRVADALVDRAADLPAHRVRQRDVHVRRRHRRRHRLEPIADGDDDVGPQLIEDQWQLDEPHPGGLHHRRGRLPFDEHVHAGGDLEAVPFDVLHDRAVAIEQRGGAGHDLELKVRMAVHRAHHGLDAAVVRPRPDNDTDFSHASRCGPRDVGLGEDLVGRNACARPGCQGPRRTCAGGRPLPGFLIASMSAVIVAPAGMRQRLTMLFSKVASSRCTSSRRLVDGRGQHAPDRADAAHEVGELRRFQRVLGVAAVHQRG